uniref:thioredoxin-dependent peroxiredoxin n=1 Tax=Ornithorhynchus anatinus TaxID=9258 RepID=A0A6I8N0X2_ORNAN
MGRDLRGPRGPGLGLGLRLVLGALGLGLGLATDPGCHSFGGGHVYPGQAPHPRPHHDDHHLHRSPDPAKAQISQSAPYWEGTAVINGEFKELKLTDYRGKYLVFFFYPLDFTFVCPTEIIAFGDRIAEFRAINTEVVACSVDSQFTHLAWINTPRKQGGLGPMKIPLLSDLTRQISKDYGVYLEDLGHTLRGLFIIDDKGVLRQITMNDLPVGRSVDETLRLVQAFQYTDKHGEGQTRGEDVPPDRSWDRLFVPLWILWSAGISPKAGDLFGFVFQIVLKSPWTGPVPSGRFKVRTLLKGTCRIAGSQKTQDRLLLNSVPFTSPKIQTLAPAK